MSWVVEEWKEGLSTKVLHKIQELESQLEKLRKERQQRQFQLESLEAALQKQKQKVDQEKNEGATLKRENQNLIELCDTLENTRQKLSHELQVKESQVNFQEGQLISSKKQIEKLEQELKRYKSEIEKSEKSLVAGDVSFSTPQKNFTGCSTPSYNDSRFEELKVKYSKEAEERKRLEAELKSLKSQKTGSVHTESTISRREIARQQASSSVFSWQQEKTPSHRSSDSQETTVSHSLAVSHLPQESGATLGQKDEKLAKKDSTSCSILDSCKDSSLTDQMKTQNQGLRSRITELEHKLQIQAEETKCNLTKLQETQLQLENLKIELAGKDKDLNKTKNEVNRITAQLDQATAQCAAKEDKVKRLSDELNCQRQNSESVQRALQQKLKEKEKEFQQELSIQLSQAKIQLQEELHQAKKSYSVLQTELEKTLLAKQQFEKKVNDLTQKLNQVDQAFQTMQLKENELENVYEEVKKQNILLDGQSAQQLQEIGQLKDELCIAKQLLQQSQHFAEDMKNKNFSLERELKFLEEKLNKQEDPLTLEKMKLTISDLENEQDSLRQLLRQKDNIIEELSVKLEDLKKLQNILVECGELKKEIESLSQWKKESEQLLNKHGLEKERLMSKISSLESALMTEQLKSHDQIRVLDGENKSLSAEVKNLKCTVEDKTAELEAQRKVHNDLQQEAAASEAKHRKERENNLLKLAEISQHVAVLQKQLQLAENEALEKGKCIASLETSLASQVQLNEHFQKQSEELAQARDDMERKLAEVEQREKDFAQGAGQQINKLQAAVFEKQEMLAEALTALEEKDEKLQALMEQLNRQKAQTRAVCEDSAQQLSAVLQSTGQHSNLKSPVGSLEQKSLDLMQKTLCLSGSLKEREEEHGGNALLLLDTKEKLERECMSLEAKEEHSECALKDQACHSEVEKATFETPDRQLMSKHEVLRAVSLEGKNSILLYNPEEHQSVPEEAKILEQEGSAYNKMQHCDLILMEEDGQLVKEMKIGNEYAISDFPLDKVLLQQLKVSVKEKEDELNKYQVKLEMLQMDLEDKEASVEDYCEEIKQLKTVLRTVEIKMEESENENERLKLELQDLKNLESSALGMTDEDGKNQLSVCFSMFTKDILNQQADAKHASISPDLMLSQNDYDQLVYSLHITLSKLNELEKMCEHLQVEKSRLASGLKDLHLEGVRNTDTVAQELIYKMNNLKEQRATSSDEKINQNRMGVECCDVLNYEDLKLFTQEIKILFDKVKETAVSLKNEYELSRGENLRISSNISELQCYVERLKENNMAAGFIEVDTTSFTSEVIPGPVDQECQTEGEFCVGFPSWSETRNCTKAVPSEVNFDVEVCTPSSKTDGGNSNRQATVECTTNQHCHSFVEDAAGVSAIKQECIVAKRHDLKKTVERLLCETHGKSSKMPEESFRSYKNLEDEEIKKIQEMLLCTRKEIDGLQTVFDKQQWQQKLNNVVLQVASNMKAEKKHLEKAEGHLPGLALSSTALLSVNTEQQAWINAEQAVDPLWPLEISALPNESMVVEAASDEMITKSYQVNRTEDETTTYEANLSIKSPEKLVLDIESRKVVDECTFPTNYPEELLFPSNPSMDTVGVSFLENSGTTTVPHQQIEQASHQKSESSQDVEEASRRTDTLLMEIQYLKSHLESKDKELSEKIITCVELDKTTRVLEQEKADLSEALKSVTFDNQQLSYNLMTLGIELNKVKSDLEMYKLRLSDTMDTLEDLEMTKVDWTERLLETENELRRIKSEKTNVENHALSMEADVEELHLKNEQLERENENKLKTVLGLQEQLQIITTERNQFTQDLRDLSKDKEELDQMCQKMQETIKELESRQVDSAEFIRILEAEAKTQTKLLQAMKTDTDLLSAEKDCLMGQLENLDKLVRDLALEKEAAESQIKYLKEEREADLRQYETLHSKLSISEMENSKITKSLEGSLIEKGELAARLNSAQEEVDQLRQGIEKLKTKIESDERHKRQLAEKLRESRRKADCLVDRIQNLQRELEMTEENLEDAILQAEVAKAETERVNSEVDHMRAVLQSVELERDALKSAKQRLERQLMGEQDKVASLEGGHSILVKQLEDKEKENTELRGKYENAVLAMESQLNQVHEQAEQSLNKQNICRGKEQDFINQVTSLKYENMSLGHQLEEADHKDSETEQPIEALIQECQVFIQRLEEDASLLEPLPKNEISQALFEEPFEHREEELEATTSEKYAYLGKIEHLKKECNIFYCKYQQWLKTFGQLKQENKLMRKQIEELEGQLKSLDPGSQEDAVADEMEELRESAEEKNTEADHTLEKYCALIINHHKLEEENEMLRTQVFLLNSRLKQSSDASGSPDQSPTKIASRLPTEKASPENSTTVAGKWQQCQANRSNGKKSRSLQETVTVMRTVFQQHGSVGPKDSAKQDEGMRENGSSCPNFSHLAFPKTSPCLVNLSMRSPPFPIEKDDMHENLKATAEGSKIQKMNNALMQERRSPSSPLGFTPRSPLSAYNPSLQVEAGRSAEYLNTTTAKHSLSSEENELDKACHVQ
ncbi:centromere protein F [Pogona vitticeps]